MIMTATKLFELSIAEAGRKLRDGSITSLALTEDALARIIAIDPALDSFITVTADRARADAAAAEAECARGIDKGPMQGVPYALKDIYDTAGIRSTCHSKLRADNVPAADSVVKTKFKAQGGVLLGKLASHEFAPGGPRFRSAVPAGAQSLEPRAYSGRLILRLGCGGRRRAGAHGNGIGHRRLDPRPRRLLRHDRLEAHLRPRLPPGRVPAFDHARPLRPVVLDGRGQRDRAAGHRRLRPARSCQRRSCRAELPGRARSWRGRTARRPAAAFLRRGARRFARGRLGDRPSRGDTRKARRGGRRDHAAGLRSVQCVWPRHHVRRGLRHSRAGLPDPPPRFRSADVYADDAWRIHHRGRSSSGDAAASRAIAGGQSAAQEV